MKWVNEIVATIIVGKSKKGMFEQNNKVTLS